MIILVFLDKQEVAGMNALLDPRNAGPDALCAPISVGNLQFVETKLFALRWAASKSSRRGACRHMIDKEASG
jgi:hypothetical protein